MKCKEEKMSVEWFKKELNESHKKHNKKEIARCLLLNNQFDFNNITEKYIADIRENWESFIEDQLYQLYEKEGFTKVLQISKKDFRAFLMWALPKYKKEVLEDE